MRRKKIMFIWDENSFITSGPVYLLQSWNLHLNDLFGHYILLKANIEFSSWYGIVHSSVLLSPTRAESCYFIGRVKSKNCAMRQGPLLRRNNRFGLTVELSFIVTNLPTFDHSVHDHTSFRYSSRSVPSKRSFHSILYAQSLRYATGSRSTYW